MVDALIANKSYYDYLMKSWKENFANLFAVFLVDFWRKLQPGRWVIVWSYTFNSDVQFYKLYEMHPVKRFNEIPIFLNCIISFLNLFHSLMFIEKCVSKLVWWSNMEFILVINFLGLVTLLCSLMKTLIVMI